MARQLGRLFTALEIIDMSGRLRPLGWVPNVAFLSIAAAALTVPASAEEGPTEQDPAKLAVQLVARLSSPSYRAREHATLELSKLGLPAKGALLEGLKSPDAEVRIRCQRVLAVVLEQDFQARLQAFASDRDGNSDYQLPGWERFRKQVGFDTNSRGLFVEMQRAEPGVMEASESSAERAGEVLSLRCQQIQEMLYGANFGERKQPGLGTLTSLFFLAADPNVPIADQTVNNLGNFSYQTSIQSAISGGPRTELLRKLLGAWVGRTVNSAGQFHGLVLSLRYDLREGLEPAVTVCQQAGAQPNVMQYAILVVGKFGNKEHLKTLEPLLQNNGLCMTYQVNNEQYKAEVRDLALAVMVHLTGQDLKEYGFARAEKNSMFLYNPASLGFRETDNRQAGFDKWNTWSEEQKKVAK